MTKLPETQYTQSGEVSIAYQVVGDGPLDIILAPGAFSHLEVMWEEPTWVRFVERLASFGRLMIFDKRGTGMSDRATDVATLEVRMDDMRAVMDAAGSKRAAVIGVSEGGAMSALFAATYPERTSALVLCGAFSYDDEGFTPEQFQEYTDQIRREWGSEAYVRKTLPRYAPSVAEDERFIRWWARLSRLGLSPGSRLALTRMNEEIDIRPILPSIRVPTLVLHRTDDRLIPLWQGRYLAEHIPGAKWVELPGPDHIPWVGDVGSLLDEIEDFLTGERHDPEHDRLLATVLFTDIVGSTEHAHKLGDRNWHDLLNQHHALVRNEFARFRGLEIDTTGDGFFATFDGPARAIRCAVAISDVVQRLGIQVRAGLHTGECELMGEKVGGIAVHIGARVMACSGGNEVLVSSTVKDLVAGSGIKFEDRGIHTLKGVPEKWHLYAIAR